MALPPKWSLTYSFTDWTTNNPTTPQQGNQIDGQFNSLATYLGLIHDQVDLLSNDDGTLANDSVGEPQLQAGLVATLTSGIEAGVAADAAAAAASAVTAGNSETAAAASEAVAAAAAALAGGAESSAVSAKTSAETARDSAQAAQAAAETAETDAGNHENAAQGYAAAASLSEETAFMWSSKLVGPVFASGDPNLPDYVVGESAAFDSGYWSAYWWAVKAAQYVQDVDDKVACAEEWAIQPHNIIVTAGCNGGAGKYSALHWATESAAEAAASSASAAAASTSETNAAASEAAASGSEAAAAASEAAAGASEANAAASELLASQWANHPWDTAVPGYPGQYSAYHWSLKAEQVLLTKQPLENGFDDRAQSTISFDEGTRTFTIAPVATDFDFSSANVYYTKTGANQIVIPDSEGLHFIYFDHAGNLAQTQVFDDRIITTWAFCALVYWDAVNNEAVTFAEERHGNTMDSATHLYNHHTIGTRFGSGALVGDVLADENGSLDTHIGFSVSACEIWDEDIQINLAAQVVGAAVPILYQEGALGTWRRLANATGILVHPTGSGRAGYNQDSGGTWGITEVGNGNYLCMHLYATNDLIGDGWFLVMGQQEYNNVNDAREGAQSELLNLKTDGLPLAEYKSIATFIIQTSDSYSNSGKSRVRTTDEGLDYLDWRFIDIGAAINVSGATAPSWGDINGTLANQTDLQSALDGKADSGHNHNADYAPLAHVSDLANPHSVTKAQVGLANVDNTSDANKPVSTAQQTALDAKADDADLISHTGNTGNPHSVTKSQVGLGNVDNTSDASKPISTATQTALDGKAATGHNHDGTYAEISTEDTLTGDMQFAVVTALPGTPDANTVYLIKGS